jgi:hypothetical protein
MNEKKLTQMWIILFTIISICILIIISFLIENAAIIALLHLISGSIAIGILIDNLDNILRNK